MNETTWYKSSYSINNACLEVRTDRKGLEVRDSKDTGIQGFHVGSGAWAAFVSGTAVKA